MDSIKPEECGVRRIRAIAEFDEGEHRNDGSTVVNSLADGMTSLRRLVFERVHDDVEKRFGMDSMLMPVSEERARVKTLLEIELYQVALASIHVTRRRYVKQSHPWFLQWLTRLRIGAGSDSSQVQGRLSHYLELDKAERRLAFTDALVRALHEAERAPLVLSRLFPLSVKIATSVAFGDLDAASEERHRQVALLPSINDCGECRGRPLENGEVCRVCANPLWRYEWLTATD